MKRFKRIAECHPDREHKSKGLCHECYARSPEFKAIQRAHYQSNKEKFRARAIAAANGGARGYKYGLSPAQVVALSAAQDGVCAICGEIRGGRRLSIDHDHETGVVRGLLCGPCNMALGGFKDSPELCEKAARYLRSYLKVGKLA